jgi:hypothetical protein
MLTLDYFVSFDECKTETLDDFSTRLRGMPKKTVSSVTLAELCTIAEYPNGLYLFFDDDNELWYVGKSTARSFIERIPSHFDPRQDAWFNTLPKKIMGVCSIGEYTDAHALGLSLRLVMIGIKSKETTIRLESVLRNYMQPYLNKATNRQYQGTEALSSYET